MTARLRLLLGSLPALAVLAASFVHTELLRGSWDRLNAICCVWNPVRSEVKDPQPALDAARALLETPHAAIYDMSMPDRTAFLYPPIAALLYAPHIQPDEDPRPSLVATNRLVFLLIALLLAAALTGPRRRWPTPLEALAVAAGMVLFLPMVRSLELNQASLYVALFVGAAWVALDRRADLAAGVLLAFAAAVKPHLFAVVPLLAFHARRTAIMAALTAAGLLAVSLAYAGLDNHITYVTHVLPEASRGYAFFPNQSFGGFFHRLFSDAPLDFFELMPRSPLVQRATLATGALLYAATFALTFRARRRPELRMPLFALAWLVTTMSAPIAWGHHYAAALFPLAWLAARVRDGADVYTSRFALVATGFALLGSYFLVGTLQGTAPRLLASHGLFGALLIAAGFVWIVLRDPAPSPASLERQQHRPVARGALPEQPIAAQHEDHGRVAE